MIHEGIHSKAFTKLQIPNTVFISQGLTENPLQQGGGGDGNEWLSVSIRADFGRQPGEKRGGRGARPCLAPEPGGSGLAVRLESGVQRPRGRGAPLK